MDTVGEQTQAAGWQRKVLFVHQKNELIFDGYIHFGTLAPNTVTKMCPNLNEWLFIAFQM
jgi:hypothetical protein